jgi:hypothetical protein
MSVSLKNCRDVQREFEQLQAAIGVLGKLAIWGAADEIGVG